MTIGHNSKITKAGPVQGERFVGPPRLEGFIRRILALEARDQQLREQIASIRREMGERDPWTYFIQAGIGGPVKIGLAKDVDKRVAALQTAHHENLIVLRKIPGNVERRMHRRFSSHRIRGEWFKFSPEMLAASDGEKA